MGLARQLLLRGSESRWLGERLAHRPFVHQAVQRFMPGEELDDAIEAARGLSTRNLATVLTLLGENVSSAGETVGVAAAYGSALLAIVAAGLDTDLSVKATHLGLDLGEQLAFDNLDRLLTDAGAAGRLVALDMEATGYVNRTLDLYRALRHGTRMPASASRLICSGRRRTSTRCWNSGPWSGWSREHTTSRRTSPSPEKRTWI